METMWFSVLPQPNESSNLTKPNSTAASSVKWTPLPPPLIGSTQIYGQHLFGHRVNQRDICRCRLRGASSKVPTWEDEESKWGRHGHSEFILCVNPDPSNTHPSSQSFTKVMLSPAGKRFLSVYRNPSLFKGWRKWSLIQVYFHSSYFKIRVSAWRRKRRAVSLIKTNTKILTLWFADGSKSLTSC